MVVEDVNSSTLPVSFSVMITMYSRMMPFWSINEGDIQEREIDVELRAPPPRFCGELDGAGEHERNLLQ